MKLDGNIVLEVFRLSQHVSEDHPDVDKMISRHPDLTDIKKLGMEDTGPQVHVGPDHGEDKEEGEEEEKEGRVC